LKSIVWIDIIHGMDIKHFDLNLLRVFDALLTEGQVTLAGKKLNRSQNTVSAALNRLRDAFEDPLFVRAGRRMEPTAKAKALSNSVQEALHQVGRALAARFDPSTARRDFRILGTDYVSVLLIPRLMAKIRERTTVATTKCTKGGCKLDGRRRMPGASLSRRSPRKAPLGQPAFQPYWGKLAVRKCVQ
jgi:hypothetical protein